MGEKRSIDEFKFDPKNNPRQMKFHNIDDSIGLLLKEPNLSIFYNNFGFS